MIDGTAESWAGRRGQENGRDPKLETTPSKGDILAMGIAEPELLAADHDYRTPSLLSNLRRPLPLAAGGQIGKLALQGR